jgi:membrane fusion protein (multidrug efflux system)
VSLSLAGCGVQAQEHEGRPSFAVTTVLRQDTELVQEFVCQIRAFQHIEVRPLERGYIRTIYVDEGQRVRRGQHLFQILPTVLQAEYDAASADRRAREVELRNAQMLREGNVVSAQALALAQAEYDFSTAHRTLAEAHLHFATIDAPFDGIVGRLLVRHGSLVERDATLTVLADNSQLWVYFTMSEAQYLTYHTVHGVNDPVPVQLRMANGEIYGEPGVIQTIEADFDNATGTIQFRAGFPNPDSLLRHGETGAIIMRTIIPGALVIPQEATFRVLDAVNVFLVDDDGVVHTRAITLGEELPHLYVVREGLEEGEQILVEGLRRVRDGDAVVPRLREPHELFEELAHLPAH